MSITIRQSLLQERYFPDQIPPVFRSDIFAGKSSELPAAWQKASPARMLERYSFARPGLGRRDLHIPNPVNQFYIADFIAKHWRKIRNHLDTSGISQSACDINRASAAGITPHKKLEALRLSKMAGRNYILKTDISQFFPSIYTHSIAWVWHGKEKARKDRANELFGNKLDDALRRCNDRKSVGIPIGPFTSHIVAEIIMSAIDAKVTEQMGELCGYRHVDDYFLCFDSDAEAKRAFAEIQSAAAEYGLTANIAKTNIYKSSEHSEDSWTHQLQAIRDNKKRRDERRWLTHFVSEASSLAKQHPNSSVMKYALSILRSAPLSKKNWRLYETALLHILNGHSYAMEAVALTLQERNKNYPLAKARWEGVLSSLILRCAPLGHHSEVAWALWLAKVAKLNIKKEAAEQLSQVQSSLCALLALDCRENKLIEGDGNMNVKPWHKHISEEGLKGPCWLLAYEAPIKGWLGKTRFIDDAKFFSDLKKRDITFYDTNNDVVLGDTDLSSS